MKWECERHGKLQVVRAVFRGPFCIPGFAAGGGGSSLSIWRGRQPAFIRVGEELTFWSSFRAYFDMTVVVVHDRDILSLPPTPNQLTDAFAANAVRLQLHALAYNIGKFMHTLGVPKMAPP
jgi:hypothetical protein